MTTPPATTREALAQALRGHTPLPGAWLACTCGWRASVQFDAVGDFPWVEWPDHLADVAFASGAVAEPTK